MNLANKLTLMRIAMVPIFLLVFYLVEAPMNRYIGVFIFIVASLTDLLDGYIARSRNLVTDFGKFMDPLADKLLVVSTLIYMLDVGLMPAWALIIIVSREFIVSGIRLVAATKGKVLAASIWGKIKTATTMVMIIVVLLQLPFGFMGYIHQILIFLATGLTVISGIDYMVKNYKVFEGSM